jgi:hypothetical protein
LKSGTIPERWNGSPHCSPRSTIRAFSYIEDRLRALAEFDLSTMQRSENIRGGKKLGLYVNNFLFVQADRRSRLRRWLSDSDARGLS